MDDNEIDKWQKKLLIAVFLAVLGGNAGSFLNAFRTDIRADPFTGTQGQELEHRIDALESQIAVIQFRLDKKYKDIESIRERLTDLERRHRISE